MQRIAVACTKGGVGKTALCVGLASALGELGERVLLIDCDAQGGATRWLGGRRMPGLAAVFAGLTSLEPLIISTNSPGVDIVQAGIGLTTLDRTQAGMDDAELQLANAVACLDGRYDTILFDTPPTLGHVVVCALVAATELIVPVDARPMGLMGVRDVLGLASRIRERHNPSLGEARVVLSRTTRTGVSREVERQVRERYGWRVLDAPLPERVSVARASGLGVPVLTHEPTGSAARAIRKLAEELRRAPAPGSNRWI